MRKLYASFVLLFAAVCLAACSSVVAPKTPKQVLAYTEASFTAVVQTLTDMRAQGELSQKAQQVVSKDIATGSQALDAAHKALRSNDLSTMQGSLRTVDTVLAQLRNILKEHQHE